MGEFYAEADAKGKEVEGKVKTLIEGKFNVELFKLPGKYAPFDFLAKKGKMWSSLVEVKERNIDSDEYPDIMISVKKFEKAHFYIKYGIPLIIVFCFKDRICVYVWRGENLFPFMKYGGRVTDTRDKNDIEPVVHIPTKWLKTISDEPIK